MLLMFLKGLGVIGIVTGIVLFLTYVGHNIELVCNSYLWRDMSRLEKILRVSFLIFFMFILAFAIGYFM